MTNEVKISGYANNIKSFESGTTTFGVSLSTKAGEDANGEPIWKKGWINVVTKEEVPRDMIVEITGSFIFSFYEDKETGKERQEVKVYATSITPQ